MHCPTLLVLPFLLASWTAGQDIPDAKLRALRVFEEAYGGNWTEHWDPRRGALDCLTVVSGSIRTDVMDREAFEGMARGIVDELAPALGFSSGALVFDRIIELEGLGRVAIRFTQELPGLPAFGSSVSLLFSTEGDFLEISNQALPGIEAHDWTPDRDLFGAVDVATRGFEQDFGSSPARITPASSSPVLYGAPADPNDPRSRILPSLAYLFDTSTDLGMGEILVRGYAVAAQGGGRILGRWDLTHGLVAPYQQASGSPRRTVTGVVSAFSTPGTLPDDDTDDEVLVPLRSLYVDGNPAGSTTTRADGRFGWSTTISQTVRVLLLGLHARVRNVAGPNLERTRVAIAGKDARIVLNRDRASEDTAQVNAYVQIQRFHDWLEALGGVDDWGGFRLPALVNESAEIVTLADGSMEPMYCNALYVGGTFGPTSSGTHMRFSGTNLDCRNAAYSSVILHEAGHFAVYLYNSGVVDLDLSEGVADAFSMLVTGQPHLGEGLAIGGIPTFTRTGLNSRSFCNGCYGDPHENGETLAGSFWLLRSLLGAPGHEGTRKADEMLVGWLRTQGQSQIGPVIGEQLKALSPTTAADIDCALSAHNLTAPLPLVELPESIQLSAGQASFPTFLAMQEDWAVMGPTGMYAREGNGWAFRQYLPAAPMPVIGGYPVSAAIDDGVLVIGLTRSAFANVQGRVYVYILEGDVWTFAQELRASDGASNDWFGRAVALDSGNLIVGVRGGSGFYGGGYAYRWNADSGSFENEQRLTVPALIGFEEVGTAVAVAGNLALLGAPGTGINPTGQCYSYVRDDSTGVWAENGTGAALESPSAGRGFGTALAFSEGGLQLFVGSPVEEAVHVYDVVPVSSTDVLLLQVDVLHPVVPGSGQFGLALDAGSDNLVVGAPLNDGYAYVYRTTGLLWNLEDVIAGDGTFPSFGNRIAVDHRSALISAVTAGLGGPNGEVRVFTRQRFSAYPEYVSPKIGYVNTSVLSHTAPVQGTNGGTAGTGSVEPLLWICGEPHAGGTVDVHVAGGRPNAAGILWIGNDRAATAFQGGTLRVGGTTTQAALTADGQGLAQLALAVSQAAGSRVTLQWWEPDPGGPAGWAATNAVEFIVRP